MAAAQPTRGLRCASKCSNREHRALTRQQPPLLCTRGPPGPHTLVSHRRHRPTVKSPMAATPITQRCILHPQPCMYALSKNPADRAGLHKTCTRMRHMWQGPAALLHTRTVRLCRHKHVHGSACIQTPLVCEAAPQPTNCYSCCLMAKPGALSTEEPPSGFSP